MGSFFKLLFAKNPTEITSSVSDKSISIQDFQQADFIIPTSEGSMAGKFMGSKADADRSVSRLTALTTSR